MKQLVIALAAAAIGGFTGAFLVPGRGAPPVDAADAYVDRNKSIVEQMVLDDIEKYGMDVYRLYLEVSQAMPGSPGSDFAVEKAMRKLVVTFPDSNICRIVEAHSAFNAIRGRDMLKIEQYLEAAEKVDKSRLLMPNGYEILPQLVAAQYNYNFHIGRLAEAEKTLDYLESAYRDSFMFQPQDKALPVTEFVLKQRKVLAALKRKEAGE